MRTEGSNIRRGRVSGEAQVVVWLGTEASTSRAALQAPQPRGTYLSVFWLRPTVSQAVFPLGNPLYLYKDFSASVGSTTAMRAVNSIAWNCLIEALTCCTWKGLKAEY